MIIFHEGLPRSGKSYECLVNQIIPALLEGRKVYSNIKGLSHEKIAEVTDLPIETVQDLLVQIAWDDTKRIHELVTNDALVCIDEVQDFWMSKASQKDKMTNEMQQFVTQHGHLGLDIVLMGQDMRDVDPIWRRRVSQKIVFTKLDAVGKDNSYSWVNYKATAPEKFAKTSNGVKKYDEKYFGTYQSHRPETKNKANKKDDRSNVLKAIKTPLIAGVCVGAVAIWWLVGFFTDPTALAPKTAAASSPSAVQTPNAQSISQASALIDQQNQTNPVTQPNSQTQTPPPAQLDANLDYVQKMNEQGRARLSGMVISATGSMAGVIEWLDESFRVKESLTFTQLAELGYTIKPQTNGVIIISYTGQRSIVTSWPIDPFGRVSGNQNKAINELGQSGGAM